MFFQNLSIILKIAAAHARIGPGTVAMVTKRATRYLLKQELNVICIEGPFLLGTSESLLTYLTFDNEQNRALNANVS